MSLLPRLEDLTPEQSAAYVNGTCVVAFSEQLAMHWANEIALQKKEPIPFPPQKFQDRILMHCVTHENMLSLFGRVLGK